MGFAFVLNFIAPYLIHRLGKVLHNMKLVKHQQGFRRLVFDDVNVGLPHITANTCQFRSALRAEYLEKGLSRFLIPAYAAPEKLSGVKIVGVGNVDMVVLAGNLVNAVRVIPERSRMATILGRFIDCCSHSASGAVKKGRDLLPCKSIPSGQDSIKASVNRCLPGFHGRASI